jgi:hypothetical protein
MEAIDGSMSPWPTWELRLALNLRGFGFGSASGDLHPALRGLLFPANLLAGQTLASFLLVFQNTPLCPSYSGGQFVR